jgi:recombination protein RecT
VYEKDVYKYSLGLNPTIVHEPSPDPDRGPLVAVYAVARMSDGTFEFRWMWMYEVEAIRARSRAGTSGPWVTDYEMMAWKTVIRRLCKYLPRTVDLAKALDMDERVDSGIEQNLGDAFAMTIESAPVVPEPSGLDALAKRSPKPSPMIDPFAAPHDPLAAVPTAPVLPAGEDIFGGPAREPGEDG